ncbi:MAG TPA: signal peptidase I, partial [Candidatus Methylomirabilis sp.]|nr:signal peptidase I [Candidatus Methylomirabilis sp.]
MANPPTEERQEPIAPDRPVPEKSVIRQYAEAFIIAIVLALVIRTFVVQAFKIPSGSMLPTLQIGDHILVNKFIYWFTNPQGGDIIVFKFPQDEGRD